MSNDIDPEIPAEETEHVIDVSSGDVMFFRNNMLNRFNLEKEKMIGEAYPSEAVMMTMLENAMMLGMRRSLELLYRRYPDLHQLFEFSKAGLEMHYDAEHGALNAGFNRTLNDILLWVEKNPDKRTKLPTYEDPIFGNVVTHEIVVSDNDIFNGRAAGVNAMIKEWAKGVKE